LLPCAERFAAFQNGPQRRFELSNGGGIPGKRGRNVSHATPFWPATILWLLGVPGVVVILLLVTHVI